LQDSAVHEHARCRVRVRVMQGAGRSLNGETDRREGAVHGNRGTR
jgi:hypothetical protein